MDQKHVLIKLTFYASSPYSVWPFYLRIIPEIVYPVFEIAIRDKSVRSMQYIGARVSETLDREKQKTPTTDQSRRVKFVAASNEAL